MIYFMRIGDDGPIKIGSTENLRVRMQNHKSLFRVPVFLLATCPGGLAEERAIQRKFNEHRIPPWRGRGVSERFEPAPELLEFIAALPGRAGQGGVE